MTLAWMLVMIMVPAGLIYQLYRWMQAKSQQSDLEDIVCYFIDQHSLTQCDVGFYDGKEKLLAAQLNVDENTAYRLISVKLNGLLGNINRAAETAAFRQVMQECPKWKKKRAGEK